MISITLYYCANEYLNGIGKLKGFYPTMRRSPTKKNKFDICFELTKERIFEQLIWKQVNGPVIYGFIKIHGEELLTTLNNIAGVNATAIYNSGRRQIFPITNNTTYYILDNYHSTEL